MAKAKFALLIIGIFLVGFSTAYPEQTQEERGSSRDVNTLYSSDVADMNFNIDSKQLKGELFPETRKRIMTATDIRGWPDAKLQYAINEMYARRNANFGNKNIKKFFLAFDWYTPIAEATLDAVEMHFSAVETSNLKLLGEARQTLKTSGGITTTDDRTRQTPNALSSPQRPISAGSPPIANATPKPTRSGKTFDEMLKENDDWVNQGMKHDSSTGALNLETSLQGGPSALELENLLQMYVEYNTRYYPVEEPSVKDEHTDKAWHAIKETYAMQTAHNKITSAKITNEYTRTINGETAYVYEFDLSLTYSLANLIAEKYKKNGSTVKVTQRGRKWYIEAMDN